MDVISFAAAAKVGKVAKNALDTVGKVGTKDVNEANIGEGKVLAYNLSSGKLEYIDTSHDVIEDSTINGRIKINGIDVVIYDDSNIVTALGNKSNTNHTHIISNIEGLQTELNKIGKVIGSKQIDETNIGNGKVLGYNISTDKIEYITVSTGSGGTGGGSTVVDSAINGRITVDGMDIIVYDDSGKANVTHSHPITDVTNLQNTLDNKADKSELHTHTNKAALDRIGVSPTNNITVDGVNSNKMKQVTKLAVTAPHTTNIAVEADAEFIFRPLGVLKLRETSGTPGNDITNTLCSFDNSDATDFQPNDNVIFDGTMKLKTRYPASLSEPTPLNSGVVLKKSLDKNSYRKISKLVTSTSVVKYLIRDSAGYKKYQTANTIVAHTFDSTDGVNFSGVTPETVFDTDLTVTPNKIQPMTKDTSFAETGSLFKISINKSEVMKLAVILT